MPVAGGLLHAIEDLAKDLNLYCRFERCPIHTYQHSTASPKMRITAQSEEFIALRIPVITWGSSLFSC